MIYGPAGSGKTTYGLCLAKQLSSRKKAIFIDTEYGLSRERIHQLGNIHLNVYRPESYVSYHQLIEAFHRRPPRASCMIIDSIAMPYRLELARDDPLVVNRKMAIHLDMLSSIAQKARIPIIVINHVYTPFGKQDVLPVGGDLLLYRCKCIVELQKHDKKRVALLKKHRFQAEAGTGFIITDQGLLPERSEHSQGPLHGEDRTGVWRCPA
ncbi:MAG: AAA family ATPase [Nanoarchaeota archaeon]